MTPSSRPTEAERGTSVKLDGDILLAVKPEDRPASVPPDEAEAGE